MNTRLLIHAFMFTGLLALAGCGTPQEALMKEGYSPMTTDQITALYSGKTVKYNKGADYHAADGSYMSLWKGQIYQGTWSVEGPNKHCWHVDQWGNTPCAELFRSGDSYAVVWKGKTFKRTPADFTEGNTIQQ